MSRRTSLKDIARELNISISTVSRALRNVGEVSEETRRKVKELAESWKYKPDPLALGLLKNKTGYIGVILPEPVNHYFSTVLNGMNIVAQEHGYHLLISYSYDQSGNEQKAIDDFVWARAEGMVICPAIDTIDIRRYQQISGNGIPLVFVERDIPEMDVAAVITDNYKSVRSLMDFLTGCGYRRIALITNLEYYSVGRICYQAYTDVLKKKRMAIRKELIIHGSMSISTSVEAARHLLQLKPIPDAVVVTDDCSAMAVMKVFQEAGLSVPDDIAVTGFNDEPFTSYISPALTTISRPGYLMGMKAMELLIDMIRGNKSLTCGEKIGLESDLIIRNSTFRPPDR
ncbi:MAG: LacI family transcriptional regulator [Bacteroidales bacterium]|nr:LacI family transcriptional regulator [Bacteroidales bacterium]